MTTVTRREVSRRETRENVLRAAAELFEEQGYAETTIRDISASAGVSVGSVMAVGEKRALLVATFDRSIAGLHRRRCPPATGSRVERIMALFEPFLVLFTTRPALSREYASVLVAGGHASTVFTELAETLMQEIRALLGESNADTSTDTSTDASTDASARARAVYLAYLGSLFAWAGGLGDSATLGDELRRSLTVICPDDDSTV